MSKTFQFTNRHGRKVQLDQEQAKFIYGQPSMRFDGEVIPTTRKVAVKNPDGTYKMTEEYVKNKDGSFKKNNKGEYKVEKEYVYEDKKTYTLDPNSVPDSENSDFTNTGKRIELRSSLNKAGKEQPQSKVFKNKRSVK